MAQLEVLRSADHVVVPWKNGGGVTQEVARSPFPGDTFDWRISIADVPTDGAFSVFTGIERILTVIEPAGLALTIDGVEHLLSFLEPFSFPGDAATSGRLVAGPTRDLNLMTRRATMSGSVEIVRSSCTTVTAGEGDTVVAVVVSGTATAPDVPGGPELGRLDAIRLDGPASFSLELGVDAGVAVIRVAPQPGDLSEPPVSGRLSPQWHRREQGAEDGA